MTDTAAQPINAPHTARPKTATPTAISSRDVERECEAGLPNQIGRSARRLRLPTLLDRALRRISHTPQGREI